MERFIVELVVANHCGVLNRITSLYAKRKYNIDSLTVHETRDPTLSVMRIVSCGDSSIQQQMARQLRKLFDVKTVVLLNNSTL
ncbi:MAG: acetolactate synthase small subunit [Lentisphaeria bacterium]|nr:acetolactate synthase small subunit [Lentisphaeria bacterium]MBQ7396546.1 acetolactate synthase small subunit [Lentisphaeria bacterium]MBR7119391.1 acetolactate synthase small subunit [Lentisphaeria bacterium]